MLRRFLFYISTAPLVLIGLLFALPIPIYFIYCKLYQDRTNNYLDPFEMFASSVGLEMAWLIVLINIAV